MHKKMPRCNTSNATSLHAGNNFPGRLLLSDKLSDSIERSGRLFKGKNDFFFVESLNSKMIPIFPIPLFDGGKMKKFPSLVFPKFAKIFPPPACFPNPPVPQKHTRGRTERGKTFFFPQRRRRQFIGKVFSPLPSSSFYHCVGGKHLFFPLLLHFYPPTRFP